MKNAIHYYYNLISNDIHQNNGQFYFTVVDAYYLLTPYERNMNDINNLYEISLNLLQHNIYCHQFVFNRDHQLLTNINGVVYVLLRIFIRDTKPVSLEDLTLFSRMTQSLFQKDVLRRDDWKNLWIRKVDYFEYQVNQFGKKFPLIRNSFSYFVGLAENAICLCNTVSSSEQKKLVLAHYRIHDSDTIFSLYNPLNFILDYRVRDVCEYFKEQFFHDQDVFSQIQTYLLYENLSSNEYKLFLARMLFPSVYFDIYEKIIDGKLEEQELNKIIDKTEEYEQLLKQIYYLIKVRGNIDDIEWLMR